MPPRLPLGRQTALILAGIGLLAVLIVLQPRNAPAVFTDSGDGAALVRQFEELRASQDRTSEALLRLEQALRSRPAATGSEPVLREPLGELPTAESFEALAASLDALRETFERESGETQQLIREAPVFGGESLLELRKSRPRTNWAALEELAGLWREDERAADRSQYLQSTRDLLRAYGPPTRIYTPADSLLFHYRREPEGVPSPSWYFKLRDGIVIEFYMNDPRPIAAEEGS